MSGYQDYLEMRGLSPATVSNASYRLKYFFEYLDQKAEGKVNREALLKYKDYLENEFETASGKPVSSHTVKNRLISVRGFFKYLTHEKKLFLLNPARELHLSRKRGLPFKNLPTHEEVTRVINAIDIHSLKTRHIRVRDKAVFELLYSTGIRRRELLNVNLYDLDLKEKKLFIREGKGKKDRFVPLGEKAREALKQYTEEIRPRYAGKSNALFLSLVGNRLTPKMLNHLIVQNRGNTKISSHTLRHACALGMLRGGADIRYIQELLGHVSLRTTEIYTQVLPVELKKAHTRFHPRKKAHTRVLKQVSNGTK